MTERNNPTKAMTGTEMGLTYDSLSRIPWDLPLDAKRPTNRKGEVQSWYPYYAGFSEDFACTVLKNSRLGAAATVLDPWNGSGTTTYVAEQLGFKSIGFDINPVASLVANAKHARPRDAEHVMGLAVRIADGELAALPRARVKLDSLAAWLAPSVVVQYRAIEAAILADLATNRNGISIRPQSGCVPPLASFLLLALMRAARSLANVRTSSNPTWVTPGERGRGTRASLARSWLAIVHQMAEELAIHTRSAQSFAEVTLGDARNLPLEDNSVDMVLTSPPYCTRIDYIINTSFELAALGFAKDSKEFTGLRRECMGSPLAREGKPPEPPTSWPQALQELLLAIRSHPSKSSKSYYYKTFWQYFKDCEASLRELKRCLRPQASAVLVLQSSYYKELYVDLPKLYVELGRGLGFNGGIISQAEVKRVLATINSRSLRHRQSPAYQESILVLEKSS